ncbi:MULTISPECIES: hypothetical protein [unclassified Campylobacter]|uniref:hypothetical protein n=1 Tax=unclassified Campylobacter TaxID=2593542 RepID=UPI0022E9E6DF|nr:MULTISPECIES: hypothetical protein [unclassified Campylobacter]MDA3043035.1 hypothetical protein [Campylobacter sp. JMF_09 ED2]MDA3044927.1 hypothetical protein [Campylobacter sp. JMF_07 ED4]MDA3063963.1 hypothetical protein [Campylobacter sp. JMF_11 EL3]MDA3072289.1 hypothetical protein [Campylobacter sp. VBCF_03 NA9]MDA3075006.1 hypothetical protein [Campylobacter sp. JMF_05 ED3]
MENYVGKFMENYVGKFMENIDFINPLVVILSAFISLCVSLFIASKNSKHQTELLDKLLEKQKEQWLYKPYVEREAEILLNFRNLIYRIERIVYWFSENILKKYLNLKDEANIELDKKFEFCYNEISEVNNFYNDNQLILKKYKIDDKVIIYFVAILHTCIKLYNNGIVKENSIYNNDIKKSIITREILLEFMELIQQELYGTIEINDFETTLYTYSNEINTICSKLQFDLDEITTYFDGNIPNDLKYRKKYIFQNMKIYTNGLIYDISKLFSV